MRSSYPCARVVGEDPSTSVVVRVVAIVTVFVFTAWLIAHGYSPAEAIGTASAALAAVATPSVWARLMTDRRTLSTTAVVP